MLVLKMNVVLEAIMISSSTKEAISISSFYYVFLCSCTYIITIGDPSNCKPISDVY